MTLGLWLAVAVLVAVGLHPAQQLPAWLLLAGGGALALVLAARTGEEYTAWSLYRDPGGTASESPLCPRRAGQTLSLLANYKEVSVLTETHHHDHNAPSVWDHSTDGDETVSQPDVLRESA